MGASAAARLQLLEPPAVCLRQLKSAANSQGLIGKVHVRPTQRQDFISPRAGESCGRDDRVKRGSTKAVEKGRELLLIEHLPGILVAWRRRLGSGDGVADE